MTNSVPTTRFDDLAKTWDIAPQHISRTHDVATLMRQRIDLAGRSAIEVGAGTGLLSFALCDSLSSVLATDPAKGMVDVLHDKIRQSGVDNVHALQCGDELSEVEDTFDLAMLQMALHHIVDTPGFLARIFTKLSVGGVIAIGDLDTEDGSFHGPDVTDVHFGFDRTQILSMLHECGFIHPSIETVHVMKRTSNDGQTKEFPIFLAIAHKP